MSTANDQPCRYLRNKEMYYEPPDEGDEQCASDTYWCAKTDEAFGPDGAPACKSDCCPGRSCYLA